MSDTKEYHWIYIIGNWDRRPVKIGITSHLTKRLLSLRSGCYFPIHVLYATHFPTREIARRHEKQVHMFCQDHHLKGEWFDMDWESASEALENSIAFAERDEEEASQEPYQR